MSDTKGLQTNQIASLRAQHGYNALPSPPKPPLWLKFVRQFQNPLIYILIFALLFDLGAWIYEGAHGLPLESLTILLILIINAVLGVWQEKKSDDALEKLKSYAAPKSWVYRDNQLVHLPSDQLLPGDWVSLQAGSRIPADGNIIQAQGLLVDESMLTGESVPVDKQAKDSLYSGTLIQRGRATFSVTQIGAKSNIGLLAHTLEGVEQAQTPLEKKLDRFGRWIAIAVLALAVVIMISGLTLSGWSQFNTLLLFAIALAVAAVPESLPAVLTLTLAMGVERMTSRKAVIKRLAAVEALGSVTTIATDKTGTLTENRMEVKGLDSPEIEEALKAMLIANDADLETGEGDSMELGLLRYAREQGQDIAAVRTRYPRCGVRPFDSAWKFMRVSVTAQSSDGEAATHSSSNDSVSYLKGAPDVLLERTRLSAAARDEWRAKIEAYNSQGYRTLALAKSSLGDTEAAEQSLDWLGLVMLWDPPRQEIKTALQAAQQAGVRVVMITGDHPATANAIANQIGIPSQTAVTGAALAEMTETELQQSVQQHQVFARMSPDHKLQVVRALKANGEVVAVTGDGVNDAPALKAADVGVAMGQRGSDVSREVADLILQDDNFNTIVAAIEEGRSIYENIQKFIRTLFSTNLAEVMLIAIGACIAFAVAGNHNEIILPLTAVQILWINLLTDSLPALAIGVDKNPGVMKNKPRAPSAPLLDPASLYFILAAGGLAGLIALGMHLMLPQLGYSTAFTQTTVFCYLVLVQLAFVFPARAVNNPPSMNPFVIGAVGIGIILQLMAVTNHALIHALGTTELNGQMSMILLVTVSGGWFVAYLITQVIQQKGVFIAPWSRVSLIN